MSKRENKIEYTLEAYALWGEEPADRIYVSLDGYSLDGDSHGYIGFAATIEEAEEMRATLKDAIRAAKVARADSKEKKEF